MAVIAMMIAVMMVMSAHAGIGIHHRGIAVQRLDHWRLVRGLERLAWRACKRRCGENGYGKQRRGNGPEHLLLLLQGDP